MKKYEIIYDWIIAKLSHLVDSPDAEAFAGGLSQNKIKAFTTLTEYLDDQCTELTAAKTARELYTRWQDLATLISEFEKEFSGFPNLEARKLTLLVILAEKIGKTLPPPLAGAAALDETDWDETRFELRTLADPLPLPWFVHENAQFNHSVLVAFSCTDLNVLATHVNTANLTPDLLFYLMAAVEAMTGPPPDFTVLIRRNNPAIPDPSVKAFVRLSLLADGYSTHTPQHYTPKPALIDRNTVAAGTKYQQMNEVLIVLSEYNGHKELLTKYLTLYHVIENFMFKRPLVKLEHQRNGQLFSIRDFRRLYDEVADSELKVLKKLFAEIFQGQTGTGITFRQYITNRWTNLVVPADVPNLQALLGSLGVKRQHGQFHNGASDFYAEIVYSVRCAVVHNKATELHLTHAQLGTWETRLIAGFLIPSLEAICFWLISTQNTLVWFQNAALSLY